MAIFSRRALQRLINENSKILSREQTLKQVESLNRENESSLAFEWEIVLINVFSKFGKIKYEPDLGGTTRPDLKFDSVNKDKLSFIADIATVSDRSSEEHSPCQDFHDEFMRIAKKHGLRLNSFSIKIGKKEEGVYNDKKIKLKIPPKGKFKDFFNNDFKVFIKEIANNPNDSREFSINTNLIEVTIKYNPKQQYANMGYACYTTPYSLTKNPLYNALKSKTEQLKNTNYNGLMAIFLCDGGCDSLANDGYAGKSYSTKQIIDNFFRQHSSISFVLLFTMRGDPHSRARRILGRIKLFKNTIAKQKIDFESTFLAQELHKFFPSPVKDVMNAIIQLGPKRRKFSPFYGGLTMTENTIKISATALLELLAGKIEQKKFFEDYKGFNSMLHPDGRNYFADKLQQGRLISDIKLEKTEEDDDWIEIEFGRPDPAISKFVAP